MTDAGPPFPMGVIHGRFQVLHLDHLKYLMAGQALCHHLVIGITNPEPLPLDRERTDPFRNLPTSNPLTYWERHVMISEVMRAQGLPADRFSVVPFPINVPQHYAHYVPLDAVFFLTIYDDWGREKHRRFVSLGLTIHVLWEKPVEEKGIRAGDIRSRMVQNRPWKHLVPPQTADLMKGWGIPERLKALHNTTDSKPPAA